MADAIATSQHPYDITENSSTTPQPPPQNPRRVANIVRQRRRKNLPSLRYAKDSVEDLRRDMGGNSGPINEGTQIVTIEGESASRERNATQYTVGNIASGRIYLRPVDRNDRSDRNPAPQNSLSAGPNSTGTTHDIQNDWNTRDRSRESLFSRTPTTPRHPQDMPMTRDDLQLPTSPRRALSRQRAHSFSTVDDHAHLQADNGTFRIVIERPSITRPKTVDNNTFPQLDVPIPHYKLGIPRFSMRGTATMRSSAMTRSSDADALRSSILPGNEYDMLFPGMARISVISGQNSTISPRPLFARRSTARNSVSTIQVSPPRKGYPPITPAIYDALTAYPDDPAFVRYNATTRQITAATPARLVAHITSPSFLDYELLSDFFLTFRSYLSPSDLVSYLVARLEWAVNNLDNFGRIVRVRTFVALRHWILNYFVDDFVPDRQFRVSVCQLVNRLYDNVKAREGPGGGDLKIIGELKKCWRRTCALYWDMPDAVGQPSLDDEILPGGEVRSSESRYSRQSILPAMNHSNPELQKVLRRPADEFQELLASKSAEALHTREQTEIDNIGQTSATTQPESYEPDGPASPYSDGSLQVMSCSIPVRPMPRHGNPQSPDAPLFPHPVHSTQVSTMTANIPGPQPPTTTQQNKSNSGHKRSGSFNDALRDERAGLSRQKATDPRDLEREADMMAAYPYTAGLIRGITMQPVSPFIDDMIPLSPSVERLELLDFGSADVVGILSHSGRVTLAANPGVRKILGSVRRALSAKHAQSPTGSDKSIKSYATSSEGHLVPSNALTAPLSERQQKKKTSQLRIDLLSAGVCESFRRAMVEEFDAEGQADEVDNLQPASTYGPAPRLPELDDLAKPNMKRLDSNVTVGSRSIVIVDDTQPPPIPAKSPARQSTRAPGEVLSTRSTIANARELVTSVDTAAPDDQFGATLEDMRIVNDTQPSSLPSSGLGLTSGPPSETVPIVMPLDQPSPLRVAPQPLASASPLVEGQPGPLRRRSSLHKSFRAPNASYPSSVQTRSGTASPPPQRTLRRKPGGDLKAVANVHDLGSIKRPRSTGSLTNTSHSMSNSIIYSPAVGGSASKAPLRTSSKTLLSNKAYDKERERSMGMVETHSSEPDLPPSYRKEVARLAQMSDDEEGDIEVALAKLEGKYERRSPRPQQRALGSSAGKPKLSSKAPPAPVQIPPNGELPQRDGFTHGDPPSPLTARTDTQGASIYRVSQMTNNTSRDLYRPGTAGNQSVAETENSESSIPLLARGLSVHNKQKDTVAGPAVSQGWTKAPAVPSSPNMPVSPILLHKDTPDSSVEHVEEADSMHRIPRGDARPLLRSSSPRASFLLDSDEELSDSSSDLSTEIGDDYYDRGTNSFYLHETSDGDVQNTDATHPLHFPPTPPLTGGFQDDDEGILMDMSDPAQQMQMRPPSPDPTPVSRYNPMSPVEEAVTHHKDLMNLLGVPQPSAELQELHEKQQSNPSQRTLTPQASQPRLPMPSTSATHSAHVPFILSYGSDVLAQQFTIIERDALDELDWKELVNLNFSSSDSASESTNEKPRDWVNYLRTKDPRGLALITARFNIVVKWAISEILLIPADAPSASQNPPSSSHHAGPSARPKTPSPSHNYQVRVSTIRKYIHIALACRRLRNFATMAQIVIALTSGDVARLAHTWAGVPKEEQAALSELERLVGPVGNFGKLRREMEGPTLPTSSSSIASSRTLAEEEQGTIPFVAVYTHDLIYNAQKPPYLPSSTRIDGTSGNAAHGREGCSGEGLVNFERHHRAAGIVKNLLRLLESSNRYVVETGRGTTESTPKGMLRLVPDALARCLWLGALTDREIAQLSRQIET